MASTTNPSGSASSDANAPIFSNDQNSAIQALVNANNTFLHNKFDDLDSKFNQIMNMLAANNASVATQIQEAVSPIKADVAALSARVVSLSSQMDTLRAEQQPLPASDGDSPMDNANKVRVVSPQVPHHAPTSASASSSNAPPVAHAPPAPSPRVQSASTPSPQPTVLPFTVFVSMKGTRMYTDRVRSMVQAWLSQAFPAQVPPHAILHSHGSYIFKVQFFSRDNSAMFLEYLKCHSPYTDPHGNCIDFYAKIDAPRRENVFSQILTPAFQFFTDKVKDFDAKAHKLSIGRTGGLLVDFNGLAFTLLQVQLSDVPGGPPVISDGDVATRLPDLLLGLTPQVLDELKCFISQRASE